MALVARAAMENAGPQYDKLYSYLVPEGLLVRPGCRVSVPFGAGNHKRVAFVFSVEETGRTEKLKTVSALIDPEPLLDRELVGLARYLHDYTFCGYFDAVRALLPPGIGVALRYTYELPRGEAPPLPEDPEERRIVLYLQGKSKPVREETLCAAMGAAPDMPALMNLCRRGAVLKSQEIRRKVLDGRLVMTRPARGLETPEDLPGKLTQKQRAVMELLMEAGEASLKEICYYAAAGKGVVDRLAEMGALEYFTREIYRSPYADDCPGEPETETLSTEQQAAYETIFAMADGKAARTALLYGVTGSGKTQVFLQVIRGVVESGRGVIVMVPEISLTPQMIGRFRRSFGGRVAVLHSALSMSERLDEWKRIRSGGARIVVGTRSAVFAPLENIGLIVMDEEQESTYKSEMSPRYHARDVARARAAYHKALLLLASATPSVESFYRAQRGEYRLVTLSARYGAARLPDVTILDLSLQPLDAKSASISPALLQELRKNLSRGEQSILLLNRRGYQTLVKCPICGAVATCPNCSVALTYHSANGHLMCHYCGYAAPAEEACPTCNNKLRRFLGAGTQKVEEELHELLPGARVLRMDMDTTMARFSHERHFADFSEGKYDIIIGTQMVAKGLDFPNVTLVGVLNADSSLYAQDYKSFERAFSLFTQVVGRSGRAEKAGRAYIQTFTPENPILRLAASQDYEGFYREEIDARRLHLYPPFCDMAGIGFSGAENREVRLAACRFLEKLTGLARTEYADLPLRILGPCECQVLKVAGRYRWRMAVKCSYRTRTRELLRRAADWYHGERENQSVSLWVDPHYESSL